MPKISKRLIDQSPPGDKDYFIWCDELKGFGVRVFATGQKSFLIQYRDENNRTRRYTIGRYSHLTPDQARTEAMKKLGEVRISDGAKPFRGETAKESRHDHRRVVRSVYGRHLCWSLSYPLRPAQEGNHDCHGCRVCSSGR